MRGEGLALHKGRTCPSAAGFTLLEILVAIVLMSLLIVVVAGSMRVGYRSLTRGESKIEALERMKITFTAINAQVESAISITTGEGQTLSFQGSRDSLVFASNYSLAGGQRGYVLVAYRVETDGNNKRTLRVQENTPGLEDRRDMKLLEMFDDISFEYLKEGNKDRAEEWLEAWDSNAVYPPKIRINLTRAGGRISMIVPVGIQKGGA